MNMTAQAPPGDSDLGALGRHPGHCIFNTPPLLVIYSPRLRNHRSKTGTVSHSWGLAQSPPASPGEVLGELRMMALNLRRNAAVAALAGEHLRW